jgi:hypothetical protein
VMDRLRYIGQLGKTLIVEVGHATVDAGRWAVQKTVAVVKRVKAASPLAVVRKDKEPE